MQTAQTRPATARRTSHTPACRVVGLICLGLTVLTVLSYWPVFDAQFINYDDNDYVTNNTVVQNGFTWHGLKWAFTTNHASNWHPLTWMSHMLDVSLFGKSPRGPHGVNLILHLANTLLCFGLLRSISGFDWRSAMVAGLFAIHPLHVESVAWVAERKDVLCAFFFLLTLWAYFRYVETVRGAGHRTTEGAHSVQHSIFSVQRKGAWYGLALLLFALGLMSKPMLVTVPGVLLLLDFWLRREMTEGWRALLKEKIPFAVLSGAACTATIWAQQQAIQPLEHLRLTDRFGNAAVAYAAYVLKIFWPARLALPYLHPGHWPWPQLAGAILLLVSLSAVAACLGRQRRYLLVGWLWYLGMLVPVIGLVQVGTQAMADRYTYLPLIGLFITLAWAVPDLCTAYRLPPAAVTLAGSMILVFCAGLTFRQAGYWHDSERLFNHASAVTENNFIAVANVGGVFFESGRLDQAMECYRRSYQMNPRYPEAVNSIGAVLAAEGKDEAIEWFRKALELQPTHPQALFNMGNALFKRGRTAEAVDYFQAAVRAKPDNHEALNNLGNALMRQGRFGEAIKAYQRALRYEARQGFIHKNLGEALAATGDLEQAMAEYHTALACTNDPGTRYSLGLTLAVQKRWDNAIEQFTETLRLSPSHPEAHYNLGYALLMKGQSKKAEAEFRAALQFRPELPLAHYNLGCVLEQEGRQQEAVSHFQEALRQKPDYVEAADKLRALEQPPEKR